MATIGGWLFSRGDYRVWVYVEDEAEALKEAVKHLNGSPTGEATAVSEEVFRDFFKVNPGGLVYGKVFKKFTT